ncbi:MAG TPA: bifunctional UDP-N-acetylglucosamine diphosphorylase/glucosamine-1-phosphate N-acetyltransferase GlmU [Candidatus Bathyarchaeia archaeon]|nr:bifunctional UDP-N-acetylglucosamine diphosphorylase/glucosamine-1-phosphate N-acetyltransferase GlmU [Candidatus Bathyarchaeia archaeon]
MMHNIQAIVLAAGKSRRFGTGKTKLTEKICGQELIVYQTKLFEELAIPTTLVVGYQQEYIKEVVTSAHTATSPSFAEQKEQLGTGNALLCSQDEWKQDHILVINGDIPLVTKEIIQQLYHKHLDADATVTLTMAHHNDPHHSYGRIIKTDHGISIVEAHEFTGDPYEHCCINAGIYIFSKQFLLASISQLSAERKNKEYYITDLVKIASDEGYTVATITVPFDHVRGVNTLQELWACEQVKRSELIKYWMERGVRFSAAQNVHIDLTATIGSGSYIGCGAHLLGTTTIGTNCTINEFVSLERCTLGDNVTVEPYSIVKDSTVGNNSSVGPFAYIREQTQLHDNVVIGNFVEVTRSSIGAHSKAKHLSYIGDSTIGSHVNIGAGTVTANFNGFHKQKTTILDNAYIGTNTSLIAPITVGQGAWTAAGSVITESVPNDALAIARTRQINKLEYAKKIRTKMENASEINDISFISAIKVPDDNENRNDT